MKVLFAVHDEKVSSSIVKKYQKEYKEIISYKNVYYFNAILKELQRDKTYDRIVIDEDLEEFTSSSYEQKDKFIFDKLDNITDEAFNSGGNDIPIILISSERRAKSEEFLVKLFGIGIYNAIIGNDRSTDEVCRLINKPRSKKEAKIYYKIDADDVTYKPESEDDVSEEEMQHILTYFNKLGKNEQKYVEGFRNIVSQYDQGQIKIIISILPPNVKAILEESSPEYKKIVATYGGNSSSKYNDYQKGTKKSGTTEKLLTDKKNNNGRPIVVPSKLEKNVIKKITLKKPTINIDTILEDDDVQEEQEKQEFKQEIEEKPKKRGRPRKNPLPELETESNNTIEQPKRKRGRPRKNPLPEQKVEEDDLVLPQVEKENFQVKHNETTLPGFDDLDDEEEDLVLPGFDDWEDEEDDSVLPGFDDLEDEEDDSVLPGFDDLEDEEDDSVLPGFDDLEDEEDDSVLPGFDDLDDENEISPMFNDAKKYDNINLSKRAELSDYDYTEYNSLLSSNRKVIAFVGTSKNGTSFIVNNVAKILAESGIDTAILDATKNKNAYYIYTQNKEELRQQAFNSVQYLLNGQSHGLQIEKNLTVYTEVPNQESYINNVGLILETLIKNHSAVLVDCDFDTPVEYFKNAQEIYLVQSMDVLTIQPLTVFLNELENQNIIDENKLKIIINKSVKIKGTTLKTFVGGIARYNNPEMSLMKDLFNMDQMVPIEIPFDVEVYRKYLEDMVYCKVSVDKYPKDFQNILKNLACVIYPLLPSKKLKSKKKDTKGYQYNINTDAYSNNGFSNSVNNTLNNMKNRY